MVSLLIGLTVYYTSTPSALVSIEVSLWGQWSSWSSCFGACESQIQDRSRNCGAGICEGNKTETRACNRTTCAVWREWYNWGTCSSFCTDGTHRRSRTCSTEDCSRDDCSIKTCPGSDLEEEICFFCYDWEPWSDWEHCSSSCGEGTRQRLRKCPVSGGCPGSNTHTENCTGSKPQCPEICGDGFDTLWEGHCYGLNVQSLNWLRAETECQSQNAHLLWIENENEQKQIDTFWFWEKKSRAWIGCKDYNKPGEFLWINSYKPVTYTKWGKTLNVQDVSESDKRGGEKHCCTIRYVHVGWLEGWLWFDWDCKDTVSSYICKKKSGV